MSVASPNSLNRNRIPYSSLELGSAEANAVAATCSLAPGRIWSSSTTRGFVLTGAEVGAHSSFAASRPRIFAVGDVRSGSVKRVASAAGEGSR